MLKDGSIYTGEESYQSKNYYSFRAACDNKGIIRTFFSISKQNVVNIIDMTNNASELSSTTDIHSTIVDCTNIVYP